MSPRERAVAAAILVLAAALAVVAPAFFAPANLRDVFLANLPVLVVAMGATIVILTGEIDVSCGAMFAVCSVVAGVIAKVTGSVALALAGGCAIGALLGSLNGVLVAYARIPSIVVTLATMVALRDGLRWATGGTWVSDLPSSFQWLGLSQSVYPAMAAAIVVALFVSIANVLGYVVAGRAVYAVGSNAIAARLAGLHVERVKWIVFAVAGMLTAMAAVLNAVRFNQIPSNSGLGLEMKVIAAAVVGGAAITGGRGTMRGTLLGVILLGAVGPALTFLGVTPYWERALQGAIILIAVAAEKVRR
jgi:rhamnose transport system permease protein